MPLAQCIPMFWAERGARRSRRFSVALQEGLENRDPFEQGAVKRRERRAPRLPNFGMHGPAEPADKKF